MRLRIATWNLHGCVGTDGRHDPARSRDVLAALDADFIGLQEVDARRAHPDAPDPLAYLAEALGMHPIAGPNLRDERGEYGNGLLSRLAPAAVARLDLSVPGVEPRGAIDARFEHGGRSLRVLATHLGLSHGERAVQRAWIRAHLEGDDVASDATLLVGDLNEWRPRRIERERLCPEPFPVGSRARSFPSRAPVVALDRILARPRPARFEARAVRTPLARRASDHLPVVAEVEWG